MTLIKIVSPVKNCAAYARWLMLSARTFEGKEAPLVSLGKEERREDGSD